LSDWIQRENRLIPIDFQAEIFSFVISFGFASRVTSIFFEKINFSLREEIISRMCSGLIEDGLPHQK
jgi:hypothetical protein